MIRMISLIEFYLSDKSKQTQMIINSNTEIERLNNIINKAIEWCENCYCEITNAIGEKRKMISSENIIEILKGEDNEL